MLCSRESGYMGPEPLNEEPQQALTVTESAKLAWRPCLSADVITKWCIAYVMSKRANQ